MTCNMWRMWVMRWWHYRNVLAPTLHAIIVHRRVSRDNEEMRLVSLCPSCYNYWALRHTWRSRSHFPLHVTKSAAKTDFCSLQINQLQMLNLSVSHSSFSLSCLNVSIINTQIIETQILFIKITNAHLLVFSFHSKWFPNGTNYPKAAAHFN